MKTIDQSYDREQHDTIIRVVLYLLGNVMILWIFFKAIPETGAKMSNGQ